MSGGVRSPPPKNWRWKTSTTNNPFDNPHRAITGRNCKEIFDKKNKRASGAFRPERGWGLVPTNHWGPSSFIFYLVPPTPNYSGRFITPTFLSTPPPPAAADDVTIGSFSAYLHRSPISPPKVSDKRINWT